MNVYINDVHITEEPGSCGSCPFFFNGRTSISAGDEKGHCTLFDESHKRWINVPSRCKKLFKSAAKYKDGERLVIVANKKNDEDNSDT